MFICEMGLSEVRCGHVSVTGRAAVLVRKLLLTLDAGVWRPLGALFSYFECDFEFGVFIF